MNHDQSNIIYLNDMIFKFCPFWLLIFESSLAAQMHHYHQPPIMTECLDKEATILQTITIIHIRHLLKRNVDIELNLRMI